ncbi:hypothetical protein [Leifsonia aquatica]|uniref:hypothetical protein n=1 Tax=Leifsonia aquatica TaxID=144185 RepID=UPI000469E3C8|nr:hypothetical protein [Leifsonia aquatica]
MSIDTTDDDHHLDAQRGAPGEAADDSAIRRLDAQLDRLRQALAAPSPGVGAPRSLAVELLAVDGAGPIRYAAVRVTDTALPHPEGPARAAWRLSTITITGLDPVGLRFVRVPPAAAEGILARLGEPGRRARRMPSATCAAVHMLLRDEHGCVRPRPDQGRGRGSEAATR